MNRRIMGFAVVAMLLCGASVCWANVRLAGVFSDHAVLQCNMPIPIWGQADPGEQVTVSLDGKELASVTTGTNSLWRLSIGPLKASATPQVLEVKGKNTITIKDVLVGEVWLCSGQSNMWWPVNRAANPKKEAAAADYPLIRHATVPQRISAAPQGSLAAQWVVCSPATVPNFSATAYFFGRHLHKNLNVPIGLITSARGGTRIETWIPPQGYAQVSSVAEIPAKAGKLRNPKDPQHPTVLYNGMIHGLAPYAIRGAIWYQGESNHIQRDGSMYADKMKALIEGWRTVWEQGDFSFYFMQIAPFSYHTLKNRRLGAEELPFFWQAQYATTRRVSHTGIALSTDIGNPKDIHPKNKQEAGRRLALQALAKTYRKRGIVCDGPAFSRLKVKGDRIYLHFDHARGGLMSRDGNPLNGFQICGDDGRYVNAVAEISRSKVVLQADGVSHPYAVRFGWRDSAMPNLVNKAGLPAMPFSASKLPDRFLKHVPRAKKYVLVYDLNLAHLGPRTPYTVDRTAEAIGAFDRVAYFMELQQVDGPVRYIYASMDAFTKDVRKLGVPAAYTGARFQMPVKNLKVISSDKSLCTGSKYVGGRIEFWPNNYKPDNGAAVEGASATAYDYGDQPVAPVNGYGSMQVHNQDTETTVFAVNHWGVGAKADIGIGNAPGEHPDWTFSKNAAKYRMKRLCVFVRPE